MKPVANGDNDRSHVLRFVETPNLIVMPTAISSMEALKAVLTTALNASINGKQVICTTLISYSMSA